MSRSIKGGLMVQGCKYSEGQAWRVSPRVTLRPGDLFRASGGPYWVGRGGERVAMGERGVFRLVRVVVQGAKVYLLGAPVGASGPGGLAWVYVGRRARSRVVQGLRLVPHRVRRVSS